MLQSPEHTISLTTAYGGPVESEHVRPGDFADALRRFYNRAMAQPHAVVIVDGVTQSRNAFLEFVRHFNECSARAAYLKSP